MQTVVSIDEDSSDDVVASVSKHTGHWCSSFADDGGTLSFGDVADDAKKGPRRLTPSSPLTTHAPYTEHVSYSSRLVNGR